MFPRSQDRGSTLLPLSYFRRFWHNAQLVRVSPKQTSIIHASGCGESMLGGLGRLVEGKHRRYNRASLVHLLTSETPAITWNSFPLRWVVKPDSLFPEQVRAAVPQTDTAPSRKSSKASKAKAFVGRGRWGGRMERCLAAARMRECKQMRRRKLVVAKLKKTVVRLQVVKGRIRL